jgi:hypothetical protein
MIVFDRGPKVAAQAATLGWFVESLRIEKREQAGLLHRLGIGKGSELDVSCFLSSCPAVISDLAFHISKCAVGGGC